MNLYDNGTMLSKSPDKETWIYVGGTRRQSESWVDRISFASRPGGSFFDPEEIFTASNEGFITLIERYHDFEEGGEYFDGPKEMAEWAFMDCDVSPLLCDEFALDPAILVHVKSMKPCRMKIKHGLAWVCGVRWMLVSLPLKQMPFVKTMRMGGNVVPVYPSALEQLEALVTHEGSLGGSGKEDLIVVDFPAHTSRDEGISVAEEVSGY